MTLRPPEAQSRSARKLYVLSLNPGLPASSLKDLKRRICKAGGSYTCQVLRKLRVAIFKSLIEGVNLPKWGSPEL